jgi:group I intron endonuclease
MDSAKIAANAARDFVKNHEVGQPPVGVLSGVYYIRNRETDHHYIGSSKHIRNRIRAHLRDLVKGVHHAEKLQRSFNKRGIGSFEWGVCELSTPESRVDIEQHWIDELGYYNSSPTAGSVLGCKFNLTEEDRENRRNRARRMRSYLTPEEIADLHARIGQHRRGVKTTDEVKAKISEKLKGRVFSEEHKSKIRYSLLQKGGMTEQEVIARSAVRRKTWDAKSDEDKQLWKDRISAATQGRPSNMKGKTLSAEARAKISAARSGVKLSTEHKEKIRQGLNGLTAEKKAEVAAKISQALKGKPKSPEHLAAIKAAKDRNRLARQK